MFIVISSPKYISDEITIINELMVSGLPYFHLRKPNANIDEYRRYIEQIEPCYRSRIVIHDHFELCEHYGLGGIHLTEQKRGELKEQLSTFLSEYQQKGFTVSTSFHKTEDIERCAISFTYQFLSPLFDSISKPYYMGKRINVKSLSSQYVIGLGGVTASNIQEAFDLRYRGVAVLGGIWSDRHPVKAFERLQQEYIKVTSQHPRTAKEIAPLQYISQGQEVSDHLENIERVCKSGVSWVQLRLKEEPASVVTMGAQKGVKICRKYGAKFILNDYPLIAQKVGADGVHLGKADMPATKARAILGDDFIIGGTANTLSDSIRLVSEGVDYIGMGPYRFTQTKKKLSPIIGLEGYQQLMSQIKKRGVDVPIVAVGGIGKEDIDPLLNTGVSGIAISGALTGLQNPRETVQDISRHFDKVFN